MGTDENTTFDSTTSADLNFVWYEDEFVKFQYPEGWEVNLELGDPDRYRGVEKLTLRKDSVEVTLTDPKTDMNYSPKYEYHYTNEEPLEIREMKGWKIADTALVFDKVPLFIDIFSRLSILAPIGAGDIYFLVPESGNSVSEYHGLKNRMDFRSPYAFRYYNNGTKNAEYSITVESDGKTDLSPIAPLISQFLSSLVDKYSEIVKDIPFPDGELFDYWVSPDGEKLLVTEGLDLNGVAEPIRLYEYNISEKKLTLLIDKLDGWNNFRINDYPGGVTGRDINKALYSPDGRFAVVEQCGLSLLNLSNLERTWFSDGTYSSSMEKSDCEPKPASYVFWLSGGKYIQVSLFSDGGEDPYFFYRVDNEGNIEKVEFKINDPIGWPAYEFPIANEFTDYLFFTNWIWPEESGSDGEKTELYAINMSNGQSQLLYSIDWQFGSFKLEHRENEIVFSPTCTNTACVQNNDEIVIKLEGDNLIFNVHSKTL